jgi:hypothetical protein
MPRSNPRRSGLSAPQRGDYIHWTLIVGDGPDWIEMASILVSRPCQTRGLLVNSPNVGTVIPSESKAWVLARIRTESAHLRPQLQLHPLPMRKSTYSSLLGPPRPASEFEYVDRVTAELCGHHKQEDTLPILHPKLRQLRTAREHTTLTICSTITHR